MRTLLLLLLLLGNKAWAQSTGLKKLQPSVGFGYSIYNESLPEGAVYNPYLVIARGDLWQLSKRANGFYVYAEPQVVAVALEELRRRDYEFGMNLGVEYRSSLWVGARLAASIGAGPHYITVRTEHQARGFIFSDNFEIALSQVFAKAGIELSGRFRYRHISNAGLQEPNLGIDNFFVFFGMAKAF